MKFAILGATGKTGTQLVLQALDKGHEVVAVCRTPSKVTIQHESLQVVEGDVMSSESMIPIFNGCDAVFSCLGSDVGLRKQTTIYSDSMKAIIAAMHKAEVKRLICMTSWFTNYSKSDGGPFFTEWIMKPLARLFIGRILSNMAVMENYLISECQDINFTIVRPPGLQDTPVSGKDFMTEELQYVKHGGGQISRADVARFMLNALGTSDYDKKAIAIAIKP
ncbi:uncharacterized protein At2g34460, chloroplastic-like isoform X2 [Acanthaster planci]|nr:uncharacterized protein At2g34460, chloroplastic-like isoform X2 [Acanthaster planci]